MFLRAEEEDPAQAQGPLNCTGAHVVRATFRHSRRDDVFHVRSRAADS